MNPFWTGPAGEIHPKSLCFLLQQPGKFAPDAAFFAKIFLTICPLSKKDENIFVPAPEKVLK